MKKQILKFDDVKNQSVKSTKAEIIDALLTKNLKGGKGDPPPFGVHC